jgi:hypothetical protein
MNNVDINIPDILAKGMYHRLFPHHLEIIPQINEIYELALAFYESQILNEDEICLNGAYFARVGTKYTNHFRICAGDPLRLPSHASSRLKSFFLKNQFRTGYATHGLFPYRGKFHPQMVKALINVMGLKKGEVLLDPMMGSGTALIEACLMGIKSIGFDASPFCQFMTQVKLDALTIPTAPLHKALQSFQPLYQFFTKNSGQPDQGSKIKNHKRKPIDGAVCEVETPFRHDDSDQLNELVGSKAPEIYDFLLLAFLDSAGYAERSNRKPPLAQFQAILERYVFAVEKIQGAISETGTTLAEWEVKTGDARALPASNQSVDGILFSPPYSFAIDYLKNDSFHLNAIGEDLTSLRDQMIGLRGKTLREKYDLYLEDMKSVLSECARVLKPKRFCTIIVGTNDHQLSKALGIDKKDVASLHKILVDIGSKYGFSPVRILSRQINGVANTMRNEYIVMLQRD